jgi:hypothetical protein
MNDMHKRFLDKFFKEKLTWPGKKYFLSAMYISVRMPQPIGTGMKYTALSWKPHWDL